MAESTGTTLDVKALNKVYRRAKDEISHNSFRIRRITTLNGLPKFNRSIELDKGVLLFPIDFSTGHYTLANLLGWRFQDKNRAPSQFWTDPDSCLLIQTRVIPKGNEGKELLASREQMRSEADVVIKTLKLSLNTPIYPKVVYSSYLSAFPLLPISHKEFEEYNEISVSVQTPITKAEISNVRKTFSLVHDSQSRAMPEAGFFDTALNRLADSFRVRQAEQNIVDLIVALEAMLGVGREELRRRLATHAAFLLGTNDSERQTFYRHVSAGYNLRNAIVHGGKNQKNKIPKALKDFFPELRDRPENEVIPYVRKATEELQKVVRLVLRAYVYMKFNNAGTEWPKTDDFEDLPFDSKKRRLIQKQLGIRRSPAKQPKITYWQSLG
jgi:hypothetical protein